MACPRKSRHRTIDPYHVAVRSGVTRRRSSSNRSPVNGLRGILRSRPWIAAFVLAAALLLRVLVPAGFMPTAVDGRLVLTICSGVQQATPMAAMPGMAHHEADDERAESPCAFADLALPALGAADPAVLVAALPFVTARAIRLAPPLPPRMAARLRPPSHGPPLIV